MYSTKRRKTKKGKRKIKKITGAKLGLGSHKFAQQSVKESKRFGGTLLAGLPTNTQTPAVTEFILEQREARRRETQRRREEAIERFSELDLENVVPVDGRPSGAYRMADVGVDDPQIEEEEPPPQQAEFLGVQPPGGVQATVFDPEQVSTASTPTGGVQLADDERSELTGHRDSVAERRARKSVPPPQVDEATGALIQFEPDTTIRNRPLSVQSDLPSLDMSDLSSLTMYSGSDVPLSLDRQMDLIRQAREEVGDESTVDRPFGIDEEMGERFYRATQEAATVTMPQRFTKTDIAKLNSSEFKEFARKRGVELIPKKGYRAGTTARQDAVKLLFSGKKRGSTIA